MRRTVAFLALLGCCAIASTQGQVTKVIEGELLATTVHVPADLDGDSFYLDVPNENGQGSKLSQLRFANKPETLISGDRLKLTVREAPPQVKAVLNDNMALSSPGFDLLQVDDFEVTAENPERNFNYSNTVQTISSIVFLSQICGQKSTNDPDNFKRRWLNKFNPKAGDEFNTMENYYQECSFGKAKFSDETNVVVDLTDYNIPCKGTYQGQSYDSSKCGGPEIFGWMEAAKQYTLNVKKIDFTKYQRWVLIIPMMSCPWAGLASVGCGKNCFTWVKGVYANSQFSTTFHELGHNLGLQHGSTPGLEYGDGSCTMGGCCGDRCFNAPHSWQAAWATPIATLNANNFPVGQWNDYTVPALSTSGTNHVQLVPTWQNGATTPAYFFSYRAAVGWDGGLMSQFVGGVSVHIFNGTQAVGPYRTMLQGVVNVGNSMRDTRINFVMRFKSQSGNNAIISLCRFSGGTETNCANDADDDCDGLIDAADPDCKGKVPDKPPAAACNNNNRCDRGESFWTCPSDCPPKCGDNLCVGGETAESCPDDCPPVCGDCFCDKSRGETALNCPKDCPPLCGDGFCDTQRGETAQNCPNTRANNIRIRGDCSAKCGDGFCDSKRWPYESVKTCPDDCPPVCGDGICSAAFGENSMNCRRDCPVKCGDRFCDTAAGERTSCPRDCRSISPPPVSAPKRRPPPPRANQPPCKINGSAFSPPPPFPPGSVVRRAALLLRRSALEAHTLSIDEAHQALSDPLMSMNECGDGRCLGDETASSCPRDCPPLCGDGFCDKRRGEDALTCKQDCPKEVCGDGLCGVSETEVTCASDCCPKTACGDGVCQSYGGENCLTCPQDCAGSILEGFCCGAFFHCLQKCNTNGKSCAQSCVE